MKAGAAAALALTLVVGSSCDRNGLRLTRASSVRRGRGLNVPYPAGDPVRNPPVRAAFARTPWVVVSTTDGPWFHPAPRPQLSVPWHFVVPGQDDPKLVRELVEIAGKRRRTRSAVADAQKLLALGLRPPADHVWLVGDEPCRAKIGSAHVAEIDVDGPVLEVSYALEGCSGGGWAPAAVLAESLPSDLRFVGAATTLCVELTEGGDWQPPFGEPPAWEGEGPERHLVAVQEIGNLRGGPVTVVERLAAYHDADVAVDRFASGSSHAWAGGEEFEPVSDAAGAPLVLLGAIVQGGTTQAVFYLDGLAGWVAVPPSAPPAEDAPDPGPRQWTAFELRTGPFLLETQQDARLHPRDGCEQDLLR